MSFTVVYDACVLFPNALRDLLVRLGMSGLFRAKWSTQILDEVFRNVREKYPDARPERLERTRRLMTEAVRDCMVERYEDLVDTIELPDLDDRHVVAAAIRSGAQVIVTFNLKDFPAKVLERYDLDVQHPVGRRSLRGGGFGRASKGLRGPTEVTCQSRIFRATPTSSLHNPSSAK